MGGAASCAWPGEAASHAAKASRKISSRRMHPPWSAVGAAANLSRCVRSGLAWSGIPKRPELECDMSAPDDQIQLSQPLGERARESNLTNVTTVLAGADDARLAESSVDTATPSVASAWAMVSVWNVVECRSWYFIAARRRCRAAASRPIASGADAG